MSAVFKRYPAGGNERLLALALADEATDTGVRIFPSVARLALKSAQSERGVQRLLHVMLASGWLILVRKSSGRRGDCNEYCISPEWLAGGEPVAPAAVPDRRTEPKATGDKLAPVRGGNPVNMSVDKLQKLSTTGDTQGLSGDIAVSPNPVLPMNSIPPNPPLARGAFFEIQESGIGAGFTAVASAVGERRPKAGQPSTKKPRPGWRWRDTRAGVERRAQQLGLPPWDEHAFGIGQGEQWAVYRERVFAADAAAAGAAACASGPVAHGAAAGEAVAGPRMVEAESDFPVGMPNLTVLVRGLPMPPTLQGSAHGADLRPLAHVAMDERTKALARRIAGNMAAASETAQPVEAG